MGNETSIQWTNSSWNPIRGCSRVDDDCINCYAEGVAARFSGPGLAYEGLARRSSKGLPLWTGVVRMVPEHLADPIRWKRPRKIFVNSMSDIFHEELTNEQIAAIFAVMAASPQHTFQVLTKRAKRMKEWFDWVAARAADGLSMFPDDSESWRVGQMLAWTLRKTHGLDGYRKGTKATGWEDFDPRRQPWPLPNVHLGVSCGFQRVADERIPFLLECPAVVRWISAEPLIGPVDLFAFLKSPLRDASLTALKSPGMPGIDWAVVGGESGSRARGFDIQWARDIIRQCREASIPAFCKQLGAHPREEMAELRGGYGEGPIDLAGETVDLARSQPGPDWMRVVQKDRAAWIRYIHLKDSHGGDPAEWPDDLRVREFPAEPSRVSR